MPHKAKRICTSPGCNELVTGGKCKEHKKSVHRQENYSKMYDGRWRKVRVGFLRSHPMCVVCFKEGKMVLANEVDHIIPHKGDRDKFWDISGNLQSLCKPCHSRKTMKELKEEGKM